MPTVAISPSPILQFLNNLGQPCAGGSVLTQVGGVNYATYQDSGGTTPLPNPIPLNTRGEISNASGVSCQLFLERGVAYTFTLKDANGYQLNQASYVAGDAGLATFISNLASTSLPGSSLVGHKGTSANEVGITESAYLNLMVKGLKKNFGAVGDGSANDYSAVNNALQTPGKIIEIEDGTYLCNTGLTAPLCAGIVGWGKDVSKLKAGTGVTKTLPIVGSNISQLRQFAIQGNSTASARGLVIGDGSLTAQIDLNSVRVYGFTGAGAVGAEYKDCVSITSTMCHFDSSAKNLNITYGAVSGCPTTLAFLGGICELSTADEGATIVAGTGIIFDDEFIFQTNWKEGLRIATNSTNVTGVVLSDFWFEGNWYSLNGSGARTAQYQFKSNLTGAGTVRFSLIRGNFVGDANSAKSISVPDAFNAGFEIYDVQVPNIAGTINIANGYGRIRCPSNVSSETVLTVANPAIVINTGETGSQLPAYAATYTPDFGLGSYHIKVGTLTGNVTVANPVSTSFPPQGAQVSLTFTQDGVGTRTVSWGGNYIFPTTSWSNVGNSAGKKSTVTFTSDGVSQLTANGTNSWN